LLYQHTNMLMFESFQPVWDNMLRATKKKKIESEQLGSAAVTFSELDRVILEVISPDSVDVKGLDQQDDPLSFDLRYDGDDSLFLFYFIFLLCLYFPTVNCICTK
jgi:hypothetical protein